MSLLHSLLLALVVVCAAPLCAAQWPCPDASDIVPCVCITSSSYDITMDCSDVTSTQQLADIFQTPFAFNDHKRLIIQPSIPPYNLLTLPANVFGPVTFQEVDITGTIIHTVEEQAFALSHSTLSRLNLANNEISVFPAETLYLFTTLRDFDISYNKLSKVLPNIESLSMLAIDMSGNSGLKFTETTFAGCKVVEDLRLGHMDLGGSSPANAFLSLKYLRTLYLDNNNIPGTLIEDFINPQLDPLITVHLNGNKLSAIHPSSVTGMRADGSIDFRNNLIEYLPEEHWKTLTSTLNKDNSIDMRNNPLVCGCDVAWLVFDSLLMSKFHNETTCVTGNYMKDLPKQWFLEHCPP